MTTRFSYNHAIFTSFSLFIFLQLCSCGTITGIPSHGGGKRFAVEQRLVSASIRAGLKAIDVSALRGKKTAIIFDLVSDEGGGTLTGGRLNLGAIVSAGQIINPITSTTNTFQLFDIAEAGTNYSNTHGSSSSFTQTATLSSGANISSSSGSNSTTSNSATNGTSTESNHSSGNNTTTTGNIQTNGSFNQNGGNTTNNSSTTNSTTHGASTSNSSTTSNNKSDSSQNGVMTNNSSTNGGFSRDGQIISPTPVETETTSEGVKIEAIASLSHRGMGEYVNFNVPKSDASLLMGLVRNYLLLNGVYPTAPTDEEAEALLYITVDVFGIIRSRFDALLYNNEKVKAETSFEVMAFDKTGQLIIQPCHANRVAQYTEHYMFWVGPLTSREKMLDGKGLLVDFSGIYKQSSDDINQE